MSLASSAVPSDVSTAWDAPGTLLLKLSSVVLLVLLNGFFVAAEFAIVKVRISQLDALAGNGDRRVRSARSVVARLDDYLSATQLGITLASLGLGWLGEPFIAQMIEPFFALAGVTSAGLIETVSFVLAFGTITILHIVLGELAPKSLAIRRPVPTTLWTSAPLGWFHSLFKPAIWVLNGLAGVVLKRGFGLEPANENELAHSEEELRLIVDKSAESAVISPVSRGIVSGAFDLRRLSVREVMTPRGEVVFLDLNLSVRENMERAKTARHTRYPLCKGHLDRAAGMIHVKDLFALQGEPEPNLLELRKELPNVPETMPLDALLTLFRDRRAHLALVVDEYGGTVGIVTLQHVIDEIVGELPDEFSHVREEFRRLSDDEWVVAGGLGLYELRELTGLSWSDEDVSTVGGYVTQQIGHLPTQGESVRIEGWLVTIVKADGRRVEQVHLKRLTSINES